MLFLSCGCGEGEMGCTCAFSIYLPTLPTLLRLEALSHWLIHTGAAGRELDAPHDCGGRTQQLISLYNLYYHACDIHYTQCSYKSCHI